MKHDYKGASEGFNILCQMYEDFEQPRLKKNCADTIRHALAMMQKLQEPSEGMISVGLLSGHYNPQETLRLFLTQAEKEIG